MKNVKLFLKSLFNNNAAIDGARKKPWYAAVIIFFVALILSLVPSTVLKLKEHGDKPFSGTTYGTQEAVTEFSEYLKTLDKNVFYVKTSKDGKKYLIANESVKFKRYNKQRKKNDFVFLYSENKNVDTNLKPYIDKETKSPTCSYFVFTPDRLDVVVLDPNDGKTIKVQFTCIDAYKKIEKDQIKKALVVGKNNTQTAQKTWENWKVLIKDFYNQTRLTVAWSTCGINAAVNGGIILIMGFMVWILTRGKNNPYRLFNIWESFKISFWCTPSPALLTLGLGFLISNFASTIFVLLLGVRVMWLTMKSLRPDGSGYAAN